MGFFSRFRRTPEVVIPEPQTMEVVSEVSITPTPVSDGDFKSGIWVKCPDTHIGITVRTEGSQTLVAMTDANGYNLTEINAVGDSSNISRLYTTNQLVRASLSDIPAKRLDGLSKNELYAMGYKD